MSTIKEPKPDPIFSISLGENGGTFSPRNFDEAIAWLQIENNAWQWWISNSFGYHESYVKENLGLISASINAINESRAYETSNPDHSKNLLANASNSIRSLYVDRNFPHSTSERFTRIDSLRKNLGDRAASFFAAVLMDNGSGTYQPQDIASWRGLLAGIIDNYGAIYDPKNRQKAIESKYNETIKKLENSISESTETYNQIHTDFESTQRAIRSESERQIEEFGKVQSDREQEFSELNGRHSSEMQSIRDAFTTEISLRAPAQYWQSKRKAHRWIAAISGVIAFGSIAGATFFLANEVQSLLKDTPSGSVPDHWRIAVIALISLFSVWAIRLVVRIFLSQIHLITDASERIVMLQTYLSLIQGGQLTEDKERSLILNALFRQSQDGIVKDEGVPPSVIDLITKGPK